MHKSGRQSSSSTITLVIPSHTTLIILLYYIDLQSTEDDHPDKAHLIQAIDSMTDVAAMINEYKRRKDLGELLY